MFFISLDQTIEQGFLCLMQPTKILLTSEGTEYEQNGVHVFVPPKAVADKGIDTALTLEMFIDTTTDTSYPDNSRPISPVIKIESNTDIKLEMPIQITIPHYLDPNSELLSTSENWSQFGVLKATESKPPYKFEKFYDCQVTFKVIEDQGYATISTKHFCFLTIYVDTTNREEAIKAAYCLCPMHPKILDPYNRSYYYVLTYYTPIFIEVS